MIEVNLLPGGSKRQAKKRGFSVRLPQVQGLPADKWILGSGVATAAALIFAVHMFFSSSGRITELDVAVESAVQDSIRYADLIAQTEMLQARRDSIAEKVAVIQEIDAQRYVWAHLMDEISRSVPDYTWLTSMTQVSGGSPMQFRIEGQAGNNFALTRFWNNLESSSFIRNVRLISTEQTTQAGQQANGPQEVYQFALEAEYEEPPVELLDMVPLLGSQASRDDDDLDESMPESSVALADNPGVPGSAGTPRP